MNRQEVFIPVIMILFILIVSFIIPSAIMGQDNSVPKLINYQGYLTDKGGKALSGNYQITFRLYDEASGTHAWLWQETHDTVRVDNGQFNVLLGSDDSLTVDDFNGDRYLEIQLANELEMEPRLQLVSVAYSLQAENANTVENLRIIRGSVNSDGSIAGGSGFTVSKTGTGLYQINFTKTFTGRPSGSATQVYPSFDDFGGGGMTGDNAVFVGINNYRAKVKTGDNDGDAADRYFTFIIIGP